MDDRSYHFGEREAGRPRAAGRTTASGTFQSHVESLAQGSRTLRQDRELAFYGAQHLNPSGFSTRDDAGTARDIARKTLAAVEPHVPSPD